MNFLSRFTIRSRLIAVVLLFLSLLGAGGVVGVSVMIGGFNQSRMLMEEHVTPIGQLNQIRALQADTRAQLLLALQHQPESHFASMHDHPVQLHLDAVAKNTQTIEDLLHQYHQRKIEDPREEKLVQVFEAERRKFIDDGVKPTIELLKSGDYLKANETILKKLNPLFVATSAASTTLRRRLMPWLKPPTTRCATSPSSKRSSRSRARASQSSRRRRRAASWRCSHGVARGTSPPTSGQ